MLPSRTLYQIGISKNNLFYGDDEIVFEYVNTFSSSGIKNYTYNHSIYKSGYRYYGQSIGASIDADSKMFLIQYKRNDFDLKLIEGHINFNDNSKNVWGNKFNNIKGLYIKNLLLGETISTFKHLQVI